MLKRLISATILSGLTFPALGHHARCVSDFDGLMTCGAHAGRIEFNLKNFGDVTTQTQQLVLCSNRQVAVENLKFRWVESEDVNMHFDMENVKFSPISKECTLIGGLKFLPHPDFTNAEQNAWKLSIEVQGVDVPSEVYVEAKAAQ
jgi:hypothetical protein